MKKRNRLNTFSKAVEAEIASPANETPPARLSIQHDAVVAHLREAATILRNHVYSSTGRWPCLEDADSDLRDSAYFMEH
jgi:hypothetical protein